MALPQQSYLCLHSSTAILSMSSWRGSNKDSFLSSGKIEGSDSQGEGLHKILYQAYHMLKKVKYAQMSTC
jgi:hypothetical protein